MAAAAALAANGTPAVQPVDGFAASVNDRIILVSEAAQMVKLVEPQIRQQYSGPRLREELEKALVRSVQTLVEEALILEEFKAMQGKVPDQMVEDRMRQTLRDRFGGDLARFQRALTEESLTQEEWREQLRNRLVVSLMRRQQVLDKVRVSPIDVRRLYDGRIDRYRLPARADLAGITIGAGATEAEREARRTLAESVRAKVAAGGDFAEAARTYSEDAKAKDGGAWGWTETAELRDEVRQAVEKLPLNQASEVIASGDELYIYVVRAREDARVRSFDEVRAELEDELRATEAERLYKAWIDRLRRKHIVKQYLGAA
jgi:peptidyl-prolyl cis-trans isomerase SurA